MVRTQATETKAAARQRLTNEMLRLGSTIDKRRPGDPQRLELLREQANLSDQREALRSSRV